MMTINRLAMPTFLAGCLLLASSREAVAVTVPEAQYATAAASCQGALPNYEDSIRKRPLSVQNEGTTAAFVTCAMALHASPKEARLYVNSISGQAIEITCTGVNGYNTDSDLGYVVKSVLAPGTGEQAELKWLPQDFEATVTFPSAYISMSCLLPPGAGINDSFVFYQYIGN